MKIYFYILVKDVEYLNNVLTDYNNLNESLQVSFNSMKDSVMISLPVDEYIALNDRGAFATLLSL